MIACECAHLSRCLGGQMALNDVGLSIASGEVVGIVGPNGAGKTTLLRILAGLLEPSSGSLRRQSSSVSYFGGERTLPPEVSAKRWVELWSDELARDVRSQPLAVLSRGSRQHIGLMTTLAGCREGLMILDEPWEGLDPGAARWLSQSLTDRRSMPVASVVSSHRIHDLASACDRCLFLNRGQLAPIEVRCRGLSNPAAALFAAFDGLLGNA